MNDLDAMLIKKSVAGDLQSFEKLIAKYQKKAFNIAYRYVGDYDLASDAAQDALIKVYHYLPNFKFEAAFSTWLFRIVINTCKDYLRKNKNNVVPLQFQQDEDEVTLPLSDETYEPERVSESNERSRLVHEAIQELPDEQREVIILRDIQGFSYEDIAQMIDVPVGTVKSRIYRARSQLKTILLANHPDILAMIV